MRFIPERLIQARKAMGWTQQELGEHIGVIRQMVFKWEHGNNAPSGENLNALSRALGKPTEFFLESFGATGATGPSGPGYLGPVGANGPTGPSEPVLTLKAGLPPSKSRLIRQAEMHLRKSLQLFATEQAEGTDRESALRTMAKAQRDIIAALDELDKLGDR